MVFVDRIDRKWKERNVRAARHDDERLFTPRHALGQQSMNLTQVRTHRGFDLMVVNINHISCDWSLLLAATDTHTRCL